MCGECDAGTIAACLSDTEPCSICIHVCNIVISRSTRGCRWLYLLSRTAANGTCAPRTSAEPPWTSRSVLRIQLSVLESSQSEQTKTPKRQDPQPIGSLSFLSPFVFCPREHKPCRVSLVFALFPHSRCIRLCMDTCLFSLLRPSLRALTLPHLFSATHAQTQKDGERK